MSRYPTMERILALPERPQLAGGDIEDLSDAVYDGFQQMLEEVATAALTAGQRSALQRRIAATMSAFHELQLLRACQLDDFENWGDGWKDYAGCAIPPQHKVRLRLEQSCADPAPEKQ